MAKAISKVRLIDCNAKIGIAALTILDRIVGGVISVTLNQAEIAAS